MIGAVDEIGEDSAVSIVRDIRSLIERIATRTKFKLRVCLSCRHYPRLEDQISKIQCANAIIVEESSTNDIGIFVRENLKSQWLSHQDQIWLQDMIIFRASGFFAWASLAIKTVFRLAADCKPFPEIKAKLSELPVSLKDFYEQIILSVSDNNDKFKFLSLIRWVSYDQRPLTVEEMQDAILIETSLSSSQKSIQVARDNLFGSIWDKDKLKEWFGALSRGLVETTANEVIQFIHETVSEVFIERGLHLLEKAIYPSVVPTPRKRTVAPSSSSEDQASRTHDTLWRICFRYLAIDDLLDTFDFKRAFVPIYKGGTILARLTQCYPFLQYALESWAFHVRQATTIVSLKDSSLGKEVLRYFHWPFDIKRHKHILQVLAILPVCFIWIVVSTSCKWLQGMDFYS